MSDRPYHPPADGTNGLFALVGLILVGCYFGLGWVGVCLVADGVVDYSIRLWHHNARLRPEPPR